MLATACGSTKVVPRTEVVVLKTDEALLAHVESARVDVKVNEDLDRKSLRLEAALAECNTRLDDVRRAQELAIEQAREMAKKAMDQPALSWWQRMTGGGK